MNIYEAEKKLLKATNEDEINEIISNLDAETLMDIIKLLVSRTQLLKFHYTVMGNYRELNIKTIE